MRTDPGLVALVRSLEIDRHHLRDVVDGLCAIGSSPLGFRTAGTPEDAAVAALVAGEMEAAGLSDVAVEPVEVDAWRFRSASVEVAATTVGGSSFGGVPGTGDSGVSGRLVDVVDARRRVLDRRDLGGAIALVEWRSSAADPGATVLELAARGALGMVLTGVPTGPWFRSPQALGAFDGNWPEGGLPMVFVRAEDAARLRDLAARGVPATLRLDAETAGSVPGYNVVGHLRGELPGPVVVGAHSDAWFRGAFDDASGVAALLGLARALVSAGVRPRHTVCFTARTGEEYGLAGSVYDWCIGAWRQVQESHPEWMADAPFHLCLEASGHPGLRSIVEAPPELATWARRVCRTAAAEGWTPTGWRVAPPVAGTEQWPFLVSGVPGVAAYAWEPSFGRTDYHTQHDTAGLLDLEVLAAQVRLYALLLLDADADPDAALDHRARARQLAGLAAAEESPALGEAATAHAAARGRAAFSAVGRSLFALDAAGHPVLPHAQARSDADALAAAIDALDRHDTRAAARAVSRVGGHGLAAYLSAEVFAAHAGRFAPERLTRTWGGASHLTPSPLLWRELASLRGEPGARPVGPELRASLAAALEQAESLVAQRVGGMADALLRG